LYPYRELNALQTVGYKELFEHFDGKYTLSEAIERIKIATRQYAKRQMTWFKRLPEIRWFAPHEETMIMDYLSADDSVS
jgi:tRNA dimethylallyltransferase